MIAREAIAVLVGFFLGSIPTAWLIVRWRTGTDIREWGSGNVGATNVLRRCGPGWGVATLIVDLFKGAAAVLIARTVPGAGDLVPLAAGFAAVLGHVYTPWLGGRGGKGVATAAGVCAVTAPAATAGGLVVFVVAVAVSRRPAVGSLAAAFSFPAWAAILGEGREIVALGILLAVLVTWWHRSNIHRLIRGEEPPVTGRREHP